MKHRLERVNEVMRRELGDLIRREFHFEAQLVTVQAVDITPDLKNAHVFISVIGTKPQQHAALAQLHDKRVALQHELAKRVIIKYTPHLHFTLDEAVERGTRVLSILDELQLPEPPPESPEHAEEEEDYPRR